eukprot:305052_1
MTEGTSKALQLLTGAVNLPNTAIVGISQSANTAITKTQTDVMYEMPKLRSRPGSDAGYYSSAASSVDGQHTMHHPGSSGALRSMKAPSNGKAHKKQNDSSIITKSKTHHISSSVISQKNEIKKKIKDIDNDESINLPIIKSKTTSFIPLQPTKREKQEQERLEKEEKLRQELAAKRAAAREMKIMLERDLDNFQYDQWKKHCIAQTFSLPTLERAFKKYYQHNHVVLIKLYIVGYFCANIAVYSLYDIVDIANRHSRLITLFLRAITA